MDFTKIAGVTLSTVLAFTSCDNDITPPPDDQTLEPAWSITVSGDTTLSRVSTIIGTVSPTSGNTIIAVKTTFRYTGEYSTTPPPGSSSLGVVSGVSLYDVASPLPPTAIVLKDLAIQADTEGGSEILGFNVGHSYGGTILHAKNIDEVALVSPYAETDYTFFFTFPCAAAPQVSAFSYKDISVKMQLPASTQENRKTSVCSMASIEEGELLFSPPCTSFTRTEVSAFAGGDWEFDHSLFTCTASPSDTFNVKVLSQTKDSTRTVVGADIVVNGDTCHVGD